MGSCLSWHRTVSWMQTSAVVKSSLLNCPAPGMDDILLEPVAKLAVRCKNGRLQLLTWGWIAVPGDTARTTQVILVWWTEPSKYPHAVAKRWSTDRQEFICIQTYQHIQYLKAFDVSHWYMRQITAYGWDTHSDLHLWLCLLTVIAVPCGN